MHCIGCAVPGAYLCPQCKKTLQPHPEICPVSSRFSPDFRAHPDFRRDVAYEGLLIGFAYHSLLKKLILKLKYYHYYDVADFLTARLALLIQINQTLHKIMQHKKVIVTSIPSHRYRKYFIKGYNQSELLARGVAEKLSLPYFPLLTKTKHTRIQAFLGRKERLQNLQGAFSLRTSSPITGNELVLIIDDVSTTGSTINEAARELKKRHPDLTIRGVVLARHSG